MNAIDFAVNEVRSSDIPYEVLYAAMTYGDDPSIVNMTSIEEKIVRKVIKSRVLLMSNVIGGIQHMIPLNSITPALAQNMYTVYNIPSELTMNKEIVSALSISHLPGHGYTGDTMGSGGVGNIYNTGSVGFYSSNPIDNVASRIGSAASSNGVVSNAHLEIVGYNTVAVYANYRTLLNFGMLVTLENNSDLSNISPRNYMALGQVCILATKSFIYRKLIMPLNSGYLSGGQDFGVFRNIIESYSSAEEDYKTYVREVWGQVLFLNDTKRTNNLIGSMLAPDL